jgi:hypothetical protein
MVHDIELSEADEIKSFGEYLLKCREIMMDLTGYDEDCAKQVVEGAESYYQECFDDKIEPIDAVREEISYWDE